MARPQGIGVKYNYPLIMEANSLVLGNFTQLNPAGSFHPVARPQGITINKEESLSVGGEED